MVIIISKIYQFKLLLPSNKLTFLMKNQTNSHLNSQCISKIYTSIKSSKYTYIWKSASMYTRQQVYLWFDTLYNIHIIECRHKRLLFNGHVPEILDPKTTLSHGQKSAPKLLTADRLAGHLVADAGNVTRYPPREQNFKTKLRWILNKMGKPCQPFSCPTHPSVVPPHAWPCTCGRTRVILHVNTSQNH